MNKLTNRNSFSLNIMFFVIIAFSVLIVFTQNYQRVTSDSAIYMDLAEKYLRGDFKNAVNGYWGPMLAWLFIPFLHFNISRVITINALNLILGVFTIVGVRTLSFRFDIADKVRGALIFSLLPLLLYFSLLELIDFLLVCFLVYYLSIVFRNDYHSKLYMGILCGILGSLAYFSKPYGFPFFIVNFLIMNVLHFVRCSSKLEKRNVLRNAITGFLVFAVICTPWITAISMKYDHLTFSNQGKGNFAPIGPDDSQQGNERGVVIFHEGLFPPTNDTATSAWEDPSYIWKDVKSWNPLDSTRHFKHFLRNTIQNILETHHLLDTSSSLSMAIIAAYILLLIGGSTRMQLLRGDRLYPFITIMIYLGGYLPFHVEHRYFWLVIILLILMGSHVMTVLFRNSFFNKKILQNVLIVVFIFSFILTPMLEYVRARNKNINKDMYELSMFLKNEYQIQGNFASNREWEHVPIHDSWHKTFSLSNWLNCRYFGQTQAVISDDDLAKELEKYNIDYYFIWGSSQTVPGFLSKYKELTNGEFDDLKIYSLKEKIN